MTNRPETSRHPLDLEERMDLHRKGWRVQPVGKFLVVAIMVAGLLGLFGNGWLSTQTVRTGRSQVSYERLFRENGDMMLEAAMAGVSGRSAISFPLAYIRQMEVTSIIPEPERSFIRDGQVWYVFTAGQNLQATFHLRPKSRGSIHGSIWINEDQVSLHHFIYP